MGSASSARGEPRPAYSLMKTIRCTACALHVNCMCTVFMRLEHTQRHAQFGRLAYDSWYELV